MVCCAAYDFTVGGSIGYTARKKVTRARSMALKAALGRWGGLIESGGATH